jgi:hypothetical protein
MSPDTDPDAKDISFDNDHHDGLAIRDVNTLEASVIDEPTANSGGAPVELESPLGYDVGILSATMLNVSQMIGALNESLPQA